MGSDNRTMVNVRPISTGRLSDVDPGGRSRMFLTDVSHATACPIAAELAHHA
jgi:hypothetical protein